MPRVIKFVGRRLGSILLNTAQTGNLAYVRTLLEQGADTERTNYAGETPLLVTCRAGHWDVAKLLVEKGAEVNSRDCEHRTPLMRAAERGQAAMVELLLARGADASARAVYSSRPCDTALKCACLGGFTDLVERLLRQKVPIDQGIDQEDFDVINQACKQEIVDLVDAAIQRNWALITAAESGDMNRVEQLLEEGADVNAGNWNSGGTPLSCAVEARHLEIASLLLDRGAADSINWPGRSCEPPLIEASRNGDVSMVKLLLDRGADPHHLGTQEMSPLAFAAADGHLAVVELLLDHESGVNLHAVTASWGTRGTFGSLALHAAVYFGHIDVARALLGKGIDPNHKIEGRASDHSPMDICMSKGDTEMRDLLLPYGASGHNEPE